MDYVGCRWEEQEDGIISLDNVLLPEGLVDQVYLGLGGVCVVIADDTNLKQVYAALRRLLSATGIKIFLKQGGRYDSFRNTVIPSEPPGLEVWKGLYYSPEVFTPDRLAWMRSRLVEADAYERGFYRDDDGTVFMLRHGKFQPISELDQEQIFILTLFGGILGLHRFKLGKFFSGVLYFFTCGFFLVGWLTDLLQLFCGIFRDKNKALLMPLENRTDKLPALLIGLVCGLFIFALYLRAFMGFLSPSDTGSVISFAEKLLSYVS